MIRRPLGAVLISFCLFSTGACAANCQALKAPSLSDVDAEIDDLRDQAHIEYFFGRPEKSAGHLTKLIEVYASTQCTAAVPEAMRPSFQYEEMVERARLARVYQKRGDATKAAAETEKAVILGRAVFRKPAWTATDLSALIEELDPRVRELVRDGLAGQVPSK